MVQLYVVVALTENDWKAIVKKMRLVIVKHLILVGDLDQALMTKKMSKRKMAKIIIINIKTPNTSRLLTPGA